MVHPLLASITDVSNPWWCSFQLFLVMTVVHFSSVAQLCLTPCNPMDCSTPGCPITSSQSLLKLMSIGSVRPSNHLILCRPFSSCPQSLPASESFPMSQLFAWGSQSTGVSAEPAVGKDGTIQRPLRVSVFSSNPLTLARSCLVHQAWPVPHGMLPRWRQRAKILGWKTNNCQSEEPELCLVNHGERKRNWLTLGAPCSSCASPQSPISHCPHFTDEETEAQWLDEGEGTSKQLSRTMPTSAQPSYPSCSHIRPSSRCCSSWVCTEILPQFSGYTDLTTHVPL